MMTKKNQRTVYGRGLHHQSRSVHYRKTLKNHRTFGYSTRKLEKAKLEGLVISTQDQYQSNSKFSNHAL